MSYKILEGKKGIIFGALDEQSIAWKTAESVSDAGGVFVLTNAPVAMRMGTINDLAKKTGSKVITADATKMEDLNQLIDKAQEILEGKIDFVLHSIGMSVNVRKGKHYTNLNHDWMTKGWDVSAVSFHKLMQCLYQKNAMNEWGSIVALSYVAAQRTFPNYNDMADNKAYLESIARSFGYFFCTTGVAFRVWVRSTASECGRARRPPRNRRQTTPPWALTHRTQRLATHHNA